MSKAILNLIDMKFDKGGHYLDDLKEFEFLGDSYECRYYAPVGEKVAEKGGVKFLSSSKGVFFYLLIYRILLFRRSERHIFLSCSYIPLFILSLLSCNFKYSFRVHSMPVVRGFLYKKIIRWISNLSLNTIFLDYPVKEFFVTKGYSNPNKSTCVIGRTLNIAKKEVFGGGGNFNLLFIGAINDEKDLKPIIDALCGEKISNLSLSFLSRGIGRYERELSELKCVYKDVRVVDEFLDRSRYDLEISRADALILPYKVSYGIRFSAVLNDALSLGKKVLTIRLPQFEYYSEKYNACSLYTDKEDVLDAIKQVMIAGPVEISKLNKDYSLEIKKEQMKRLGL